MWDSGSPTVSMDTLSQPKSQGGKKLLNIKARNEAIELMKIKTYLNLAANRPRWAKVANTLIAKSIPASHKVEDDISATNMFLQSWSPTMNCNSKMPAPLVRM